MAAETVELLPSEGLDLDEHFLHTVFAYLQCSQRIMPGGAALFTEPTALALRHLSTLQESVSSSQMEQMIEAGVHLVVATGLAMRYPSAVWLELISLESFTGDICVFCLTVTR